MKVRSYKEESPMKKKKMTETKERKMEDERSLSGDEYLLKDESSGARGELQLPAHIDFLLDLKAPLGRGKLFSLVSENRTVISKCYVCASSCNQLCI